MQRTIKRSFSGVIMLAILGLCFAVNAAAEQGDKGGWEIDSKYNKFYDYREVEKFRATVVGFKKVTPMKGMSPGIAVLVSEFAGEVIEAHVCPEWFCSPKDIGLKKGDRIKIRGCWAEINGKDIFMVSKIKKGDFFQYKVRLTKNGKPFWTMPPEELAHERASQ
jgi:hypothetical protein